MIKKLLTRISKIISLVFIGIIRFYQSAISPHTPSSCRYSPTCSEYSIQAIKKYGPFKGSYLAIKRILRCNPCGGSGFDPLP